MVFDEYLILKGECTAKIVCSPTTLYEKSFSILQSMLFSNKLYGVFNN